MLIGFNTSNGFTKHPNKAKPFNALQMALSRYDSRQWSLPEPIWQWLVRKWEYSVPEKLTVTTNLEALQGEPITELYG